MPNETLQRKVQFATIVGTIVTAASMVFGVMTYQRSSSDQRHAAAIGMLQDYLKLAVEHPDLASRAGDEPVDDRYNWFATHALFTAETLWTLVGADPRWQSAIDSILRQHVGYLKQGVLICGDFQPGFVNYMETRVQELKCGK